MNITLTVTPGCLQQYWATVGRGSCMYPVICVEYWSELSWSSGELMNWISKCAVGSGMFIKKTVYFILVKGFELEFEFCVVQ